MDGTLYQLLILFLLFYFFLILPELKKAKKHQEMLSALKKGDKVLTRGGLYGTITKVENDNDLSLKIADGVEVVINKIGILSLADEQTSIAAPAPKTSGKTKKSKK